MIEAKEIKNKICPVLICDKCKQIIEHNEDGIVVFPYKLGGVKFYHKTKCDPNIGGWWDLDVFFYYLVKNLKIDLEKSGKSARMLMQI